MGLGFGTSKQKTKSQQQSGINPTQAQITGAQLISNITGEELPHLGGGTITSQFGPGGLSARADEIGNNIPLLELDKNTDLTLAQQNQAQSFTDRLVRSLFSKLSSGAALQGQTSVSNLSNLIGSSAENAAFRVLPQTLQLAGQNRLFNTLSPQRTRLLGFEAQTDLQRILAGLVTGTSFGKSSGSGSAFNFDSGLSAGFESK